jgi:DNA-binding transcriptional LysR family regulator
MRWAKLPGGRLKIACLAYLVPRYLPSLLSSFSAAHPEIEVDFVEGDQKHLVDSMMTGETELALSYDLDLPSSVSSEPLVDLEPYVIVAKRHRLAGENGSGFSNSRRIR